MPEYTIDDEGNALDANGNPFEVDGEPVKIGNAVTKDRMNETIQERLKRVKKSATTPEDIQSAIDEAKAEAANAATVAERDKVKRHLASLETEKRTLAEELDRERQGRTQDQIRVEAVSLAADKFINPSRDLVPELLRTHKREKVGDQVKDTFEIETDKGKQAVSLKEAVEHYASREDFAHYIRATGGNGSGGARTQGKATAKPRNQMTNAEKSAFAKEHGAQAFSELPLT